MGVNLFRPLYMETTTPSFTMHILICISWFAYDYSSTW